MKKKLSILISLFIMAAVVLFTFFSSSEKQLFNANVAALAQIAPPGFEDDDGGGNCFKTEGSGDQKRIKFCVNGFCEPDQVKKTGGYLGTGCPMGK